LNAFSPFTNIIVIIVIITDTLRCLRFFMLR